MSDKQQSAVQYLHNEYKKILGDIIVTPTQAIEIAEALGKAKELFKQQIIDARVDGMVKGIGIGGNPINYKLHETHEQYFNETFKTESNGK